MEPANPPTSDPITLEAAHRARLSERQLWFVVAGLGAPYVAIVLGWWVAERLAGGRNDYGYWDTAENWVYRGVALTILMAGWAFLKLVRGIRRSDQQAVAAVLLGMAYIASLVGMNFWAYTMTSGPFP
jgi:hypothetical protein